MKDVNLLELKELLLSNAYLWYHLLGNLTMLIPLVDLIYLVLIPHIDYTWLYQYYLLNKPNQYQTWIYHSNIIQVISDKTILYHSKQIQANIRTDNAIQTNHVFSNIFAFLLIYNTYVSYHRFYVFSRFVLRFKFFLINFISLMS